MSTLFDVIEVSLQAPHQVRVMEQHKNERDADAIVKLAVMRRGVGPHFFVAVPAGEYTDGDQWYGAGDKR